MSKQRFIVIINQDTNDVVDALRAYCKEKGWAWWHWIANTWLLVNRKEKTDCSTIRSAIGAAFPDARLIVFEIKEDTWAGRGIKTEQKDMFKWLQSNWNNTDMP